MEEKYDRFFPEYFLFQKILQKECFIYFTILFVEEINHK